MDKIWDRNPSKSDTIGRCGGDGKNEWPRETENSRTMIKKDKKVTLWHRTATSRFELELKKNGGL